MTLEAWTRRDFSLRLASLCCLPSVVRLPLAAVPAAPQDVVYPGISRQAEALHQEVVFDSTPARLYQVLVDEKQFQQMTGLPTHLASAVCSEFSLFDGRITGRQLELVPAERVIQVWRSESWRPHLYSLASFELLKQGTATKVVLDHTGFPVGQAAHLAEGWKSHYWDPLKKYLAS